MANKANSGFYTSASEVIVPITDSGLLFSTATLNIAPDMAFLNDQQTMLNIRSYRKMKPHRC